MSFNIILTFRVNCKNSLWNLVVIFNFRGGSTFYFRPILHSFPRELRSLQRTKTILRDRVRFYQEKEAVFEVILSTCSEFSQIRTPHFSLEGVSPFLTDILNTSIRLGTYPSKLKMAKITPVFKGDDDTDANNYRPISLLSNFNRVFEKIICKRLTSHIEKHDLLNPSQYGFRN